MTPLERCWAAALCASGDAVANMGTDALRLVATKKPQDVTSAGIMESTHKLARACHNRQHPGGPESCRRLRAGSCPLRRGV